MYSIRAVECRVVAPLTLLMRVEEECRVREWTKGLANILGGFRHREDIETETLIEECWGKENCHFT